MDRVQSVAQNDGCGCCWYCDGVCHCHCGVCVFCVGDCCLIDSGGLGFDLAHVHFRLIPGQSRGVGTTNGACCVKKSGVGSGVVCVGVCVSDKSLGPLDSLRQSYPCFLLCGCFCYCYYCCREVVYCQANFHDQVQQWSNLCLVRSGAGGRVCHASIDLMVNGVDCFLK